MQAWDRFPCPYILGSLVICYGFLSLLCAFVGIRMVAMTAGSSTEVVNWLCSTVRVLQNRILFLEAEYAKSQSLRPLQIQISLAAALNIPVLAPRFRWKRNRPCDVKIIAPRFFRFVESEDEEDNDVAPKEGADQLDVLLNVLTGKSDGDVDTHSKAGVSTSKALSEEESGVREDTNGIGQTGTTVVSSSRPMGFSSLGRSCPYRAKLCKWSRFSIKVCEDVRGSCNVRSCVQPLQGSEVAHCVKV